MILLPKINKANIKMISALFQDQLLRDIDIIYLIVLKVKETSNNNQVLRHQKEGKNLKGY